jgi:hypothetical protein
MQKEFGYVGCDVDVLPQVDRLCSGQRKCRFKVADYLHGMQRCPIDLAPFLEVQYQCWPGGSFALIPSLHNLVFRSFQWCCRPTSPVAMESQCY